MLELITDRTASDVANRTKKGYYSADDLNRVTTAMKYLDSELRKAGYESGYDPIVMHSESGGVLPEGYTQLEYIESSGTQYIDTLFNPRHNTRVIIDIEPLEVNGWSALFGCRDESKPNAPKAYLASCPSVSQIRSDYYGSSLSETVDSVIVRFSAEKNGNVFQALGKTITNTASSSSSDLPLYAMALNDVGEPAYYIAAKLYALTVYDDGNLFREFIPCKSPDGAIGLYDTVNGRFYGNSGTGNFIAGPEITTDPEPDPIDQYTWLETDEPNRTQTEQYLSNVQKIRSTLSVFTSTPKTPKSMRLLNHTMANDIEKILLDVETVLTNMLKTVDLGWALGIAHTGLYGGV